MSSSYGENIRLNIFGQSHSPAIGMTLEGIPAGERGARWYYYAAAAHSGLGNRTEALNMARQAVNMEPANYEYRRLLEQLQYGATQYQQFGRGFQMPNMDMSKLCLCLCGARICFPYCFFFPC